MGQYADLAWTADAECREYPVDLFFPEKQGQNYDDARRVCATCPVTNECLAYADAIETGSLGALATYHFGLFGGLSPRQRADRRRHLEQENAA